MEFITDKKVLCRTLLARGEIRQMQVLDLSADELRVHPFTVETEATVFEPRPVAILDRSKLGKHIHESFTSTGDLTQLNCRLISRNLYYNGVLSDEAILCVL